MVKHIHVILSDEDYRELIKIKGSMTWEELLKEAKKWLKE